MAETRGTRELHQAGIEHRLMRYAYGGEGPVAAEAAAQLGVEPDRLFKSLVALAGDQPVFALVPADRELSLKRLAEAAGVKHAEMAARTQAQRVSGYQVGGISPLGSKRRLAVFIDDSALAHELIYLNAGGRGLIVELATAALIDHTGAVAAPLGQL
jgi:Cys-tRNA(Pro)/Cys-tRNA(Cys) deacylase